MPWLYHAVAGAILLAVAGLALWSGDGTAPMPIPEAEVETARRHARRQPECAEAGDVQRVGSANLFRVTCIGASGGRFTIDVAVSGPSTD